jgi:hypothetical protein
VLFDPRLRGWYSADLHHHADQAEAVTPPADLARSQLAAGLDLLFVSDHDSTVNHAPLSRIATDRGVPFIPGIELSPSWGHFNAYPLVPGSRLAIDTSTASVEQVLAEARRMGATVVQVNHPFIPFGYLTSVANKVAPGGLNEDFDLLEFNSSQPQDDERVFAKLCEYWNARAHHYVAGGSDTHDVWNEQSGKIRTYVHVDAAISAQAFAQSLKEGHAYVTYGPLVFPSVMFGSTLRVKPGARFTLRFDLASSSGLRRAELIGGDGSRQDVRYADAPLKAHAEFSQRTDQATWFALVVEDAAGRRAYTDPIWAEPSPAVPPSENHR